MRSDNGNETDSGRHFRIIFSSFLGAAFVLAAGCHGRNTTAVGIGAGIKESAAAEQLEAVSYRTNLLFPSANISRADFGGVWGATVSMDIKNNGERPVSGLTIMICLIDTNGLVCRREPFIPFNNQTNYPLLPGRTWFSDRSNPFLIVDVPDQWKGGSDYAEIADVQFQK